MYSPASIIAFIFAGAVGYAPWFNDYVTSSNTFMECKATKGHEGYCVQEAAEVERTRLVVHDKQIELANKTQLTALMPTGPCFTKEFYHNGVSDCDGLRRE